MCRQLDKGVICPSWTEAAVDNRQQIIMKGIHQACRETIDQLAAGEQCINGSIVAGAIRVITVRNAMLDQNYLEALVYFFSLARSHASTGVPSSTSSHPVIMALIWVEMLCPVVVI